MKSFELITEDHFSISVTIFTPEIPNHKIVIINSATGVKQQIYFSFAKYLQELGFTVMTYDYRGIGLSKPSEMKGYKANMCDWGSFDFKAVTTFVQNKFPDYEKYMIGHSVGALITGMNPDSVNFDKLIFIATQNAYVGHLNLETKVLAYFAFGFLRPLLNFVLGYFPANVLGLGESLPKGVSEDWSDLILTSKSTDLLLERSKIDISKSLNKKAFVVYAEDDTWLTESGVKSLLEETYPKLNPKYQILKKSKSPKNEIGHVNFFRSYNQPLWSILEEQLTKN